jgi:hypothetical protein
MLHERGVTVPKWVTRRIQELAAADPRSTSFRYGGLGNGASYVSLPHLQNAMFALAYALCEMVGWPATERMEEAVRHCRPEDSNIDFRGPDAPSGTPSTLFNELPHIS